MAFQILFPLRHFLYPGDPRWTGEGFRFSWNVLAMEKAGDVTFRITDGHSARTTQTDASKLYTAQQWRTMSTDPELIRQAAHDVRTRRSRDTRCSRVPAPGSSRCVCVLERAHSPADRRSERRPGGRTLAARSPAVDQTRSMIVAEPMPPAAHMATAPNWESERSSSLTIVTIMRAPVQPIG